jgi:pimeloyl-ACP methyl ester carboxylesterase
VPLLLIAAERDGTFPVSEEKRVAKKYHAELQVIPDQGHNLMVERDWQHVATRIRSWLESR